MKPDLKIKFTLALAIAFYLLAALVADSRIIFAFVFLCFSAISVILIGVFKWIEHIRSKKTYYCHKCLSEQLKLNEMYYSTEDGIYHCFDCDNVIK